MQENAETYVKIGAVAYAPTVVTVWEGMKEYLQTQGLQMDFVLYSSYPALVDALVSGHVDIAWNTPLGYLQAKEKLGGQCLVLGMRDSDLNFKSVFITQADSAIRSLVDLKGKRFALGSRDSSHAAILPVHFLRDNGIDPDADLTLIRFDTDIGKHGDTGTSERDVARAVSDRAVDAGAIGKATWDSFLANRLITPTKLRIFWTSPGYSHCNFTAGIGLPKTLAERFMHAIQAMNYDAPQWKRIMDLEGLTRWMPGSTEGYKDLEVEARRHGMLEG